MALGGLMSGSMQSNMIRTRAVAVLLLAGALALSASGCGNQSKQLQRGPIKLLELRNSGRPYYWLGRSFDGLQLTYADATSAQGADFIYGQCKAGGGFLIDSGCEPPLTVQNKFCPVDNIVVVIYTDGKSPGRAARAAKAIRRLDPLTAPGLHLTVRFGRSPPC